MREFRFENAEEYSVKDEIKAEIFAAGDKIDATAISKGKGFQGAIKRHGQMGHKQITVQNLEVVKVDAENNLILVKGAVPGPKKCLVTVKETVKVEK